MLKSKATLVTVSWVDNLLLKGLLTHYTFNDSITCVISSFCGSKPNGRNNIIK